MNNVHKIALLIFVCVLTISQVIAAETNARKKQGSKNPTPPIQQESELKKGKKIVDGELSFQDRDLETGIYQEVYGIDNDGAFTSFVGHLNASFKNTTDVMTFEFIYGWYTDLGKIEFSAARTNMIFDRVTDYYNEEPDAKDTLMSFGVGYGFRTKMVQHLFNSESIFDTTVVSVTYNAMDETSMAKTLTGFGLKTDFGIHSRVNQHMHYGVKLSYHLADLKKPATDKNETGSSGTTMITYTTLAFDVTFYF